MVSKFRVTSPVQCNQASERFDTIVLRWLSDLTAATPFSAWTRSLISLSRKLGGLGLPSATVNKYPAYIASFLQCRSELIKLGYPRLPDPANLQVIVQLLNTSLSSNDKLPLNLEGAPTKQRALTKLVSKATLERLLVTAPTSVDKATLIAHSAPKASAYLNIIPTGPLDNTKDLKFSHTLLCTRLHLNVYDEQTQCPLCERRQLDRRGIHALACMSDGTKLSQHNQFAKFLTNEARAAGYTAKCEVSNLTISPHTQMRPADLKIDHFTPDINLAVDVTSWTPICPTNLADTLTNGPLATAEEAYQEKVTKYTALLLPGIELQPIVFLSTGGCHPSVIDFAKKLARRSCHSRRIHADLNCKHIMDSLMFITAKSSANAILSRAPKI
jgi:hypothetical protein